MQGVSEQSKGSFKKKKQQSSSQAATGYKTKCSFCSGEHKTFKCSKWLEADVPKRLEMVKKSHLCANCVGEGHKAEGCNRFEPCEIDGSTEKHNGKLHPSTAKKPSTGCMALAVGDANGFVVRGQRVSVTLSFLRLQFKDRAGGWRSLMVLVDEGAERSLIRKSTGKQLEWTRRGTTVLKIRGVGYVVTDGHIGELTVLDHFGGGVSAKVTSMTDPVGEIDERDWGSLKSKWQHLTDLPLTKVGGKVDMILGLDNYDLIRGREIRAGNTDGEPVATLSKLGWFVRNPTGEPDTDKVAGMHVVVSHTLEGMFRQFTQTESYEAELKAAPGFSGAEQKAADAVAAGYVKLTVGVQVPVLWVGPSPENDAIIPWALRH